MIADQLHTGFYILLSSVHELVVVPATASVTVEELKAIAKCANESGRVKLEDILSDTLYYYSRKSKNLERIG